jgi:hypothetical protein
MLKKYISLISLLTITACTEAKSVNSKVYQCVANNQEYSERCKLQSIKELYEKEELTYYFKQVGKLKFEKEVPLYVNNYIKNAELYCGMSTSFSFVDIPSNENEIYENSAKCLIPQYTQLGNNLRSMTDTATKTIIERVNRNLSQSSIK